MNLLSIFYVTIICLTTACCYAAQQNDSVDVRQLTTTKNFYLYEGGTISLDINIGNISIIEENIDSVEVDLRLTGTEREISAYYFTNKCSVNNLEIEGRRANPSNLNSEYVIKVPRGKFFRIKLNTNSGNLNFDRLTKGKIEATTGAGNISVKNVSATVSATSTLGNIRVENSSGIINASTLLGNASADIPLDFKQTRISSLLGIATIKISVDVSTNVDVKIKHKGKIIFNPPEFRSKFLLESKDNDAQHLECKINQAEPLVQVYVEDGDIHFEGKK